MSAHGIQPQSGSGAGEYEEWANSTQYGPEDWGDFENMQDQNEYDDYHPDDENDCYYMEDFDSPERQQSFVCNRTYSGIRHTTR